MGSSCSSQKIFLWTMRSNKKILKEQHKSNNKFNSYLSFFLPLHQYSFDLQFSSVSISTYMEVSSSNHTPLTSVWRKICRLDNTVQQYKFIYYKHWLDRKVDYIPFSPWLSSPSTSKNRVYAVACIIIFHLCSFCHSHTFPVIFYVTYIWAYKTWPQKINNNNEKLYKMQTNQHKKYIL